MSDKIGKLLCFLGLHLWHKDSYIKTYGYSEVVYRKTCKRNHCGKVEESFIEL
jgi:hypothetical protein